MTDPLNHRAAAAADVVVLGGGAAGLMAAIEAADQGADTLLLESEAEIGGSTGLSGGYVALCETDLQPGSRAELLADLAESHDGDAYDALSQLYVDHAPGMYRRLGDLGLRFTGLTQFAHMSRPWGHELPMGGIGGGAQIVEMLASAARDRGVQLVTSARARRLARNGSGAVEAVEIETSDDRREVAARSGVVLATGGFTRNRALVRNFGRPGTENIYPITGNGSHGDGLIMGMALGAATSYLGPGIAPTGPVEPTTGTGCLVNYAGGILLGKDGRRFCNESASYLDISWAALGRSDPLMLQIFDEAILETYQSSMLGQVLAGWKTHSAPTLEGLLAAAGSGIDRETALATIREYNDAARVGRDPQYGRTHLLGTTGDLVAIDTPPFYSIATVAGTTHFNGGLKIDETMRVIDVFGEPIPCLYAAGEVTGGFHGAGYLSATHLGSALIFGKLAGASAVTEP